MAANLLDTGLVEKLQTVSNGEISDIESYKRREITLILLNIGVLAALFVVHVIFLFEIGKPSAMLLATLTVRFVVLMIELFWIQRLTAETSVAARRTYTHLSIAINIFFAFIASVFGGTADSHYSVLMIIPIIQAAYHFNLLKTLAVAGLAIILTFAEVWIYFYRKPPVDYGEFFEAATVALIFFVVGLVVWLLVGNLREEESKLQESLRELKATQARLVNEEKLAAVDELSSAIAHEIRNPVTMIASSLDLASKQPENSTLRAEMFAIATQESKRLETLTGDFLTFARTNEPIAEQNDVNETLEYCAALARARLAKTATTISVDCPSEITARFDATQIRQALLNLVLNAAEAVMTGGRIAIGAEISSSTLFVFVENDGPAIAAEIAEQIFDPFFTAKPKGTGLGLAIVRRIARAHKGEIALVKNDDGAVKFVLSLPQKPNGQNSDH